MIWLATVSCSTWRTPSRPASRSIGIGPAARRDPSSAGHLPTCARCRGRSGPSGPGRRVASPTLHQPAIRPGTALARVALGSDRRGWPLLLVVAALATLPLSWDGRSGAIRSSLLPRLLALVFPFGVRAAVVRRRPSRPSGAAAGRRLACGGFVVFVSVCRSSVGSVGTSRGLPAGADVGLRPGVSTGPQAELARRPGTANGADQRRNWRCALDREPASADGVVAVSQPLR